jgi:hypothetical protein
MIEESGRLFLKMSQDVEEVLSPPYDDENDDGVLKAHEAIQSRESRVQNRVCGIPNCRADPKLRSQQNWARSICMAKLWQVNAFPTSIVEK